MIGDVPIRGTKRISDNAGAVEDSKTEISADDSRAVRAVKQVFFGPFVQEIKTGLTPLSACGTVNDAGINGAVNGELYLKEV
ncbi:MAG: hypothetical protein SVU69_12440 [Pseudomonadota bacterium]|nr:hypothetical protein [Pseudomonadota bacterium]